MKKTLLLIAAVALGASLVGCGSKSGDDSSAAPTSKIKDRTPKDDAE